MAFFLAPIINDQQEDSNGAPLSGGTIEVYLAGTSTPATTYSDNAGLVPNTNPIVLNTLGLNNQGAVWLTGGASYKFIIKNSVGVVQRTIDNVSGINDSAVTTDQWLVYQGTPTFVSTTSFTVAGDQTQTFQVGRRIKTTNTGGVIYSTITGSVYVNPNTTVTVRNDSGVLDAGLSSVSYGVLSVLNTSLPGGMINYGQCRLVKSGANLVLLPYNGNRITINGSVCLIPAAGVSLAPTSLTPSTLYYIYAYMNGATLTLEAVVTTHATDAVTGVEIKSGDATRALVGMARPIAGPAWQDSASQRLVMSWFNQKGIVIRAQSGVSANYSLTTPTELNNLYRSEWLQWTSNPILVGLTGTGLNNTTPNTVVSSLMLDSAITLTTQTLSEPLNNGTMNISQTSPITTPPAEGYHYVTFFASVSGGTGTWTADCFTWAQVQG